MNSVSSNRLVIFSKSADAGEVKTRMRSVLSEDERVALHVALLKDTLEKTNGMNRVLYLYGSGNLPIHVDCRMQKQVGDDLGSRLFHAFQNELADAPKVVIIGTDSPTVPVEFINNAFLQLEACDAVFGPAEDGGYYLIGLSTLIPEIFEDIAWGGPDVLRKSLQKIGSHRFVLLETSFDVDTPEDLLRIERLMPDFPSLVNLNGWLRDRRSRSGAGGVAAQHPPTRRPRY